ncbi:MAG: hypothetical protein AAFQ82_04025 [Myxococcota bacterium]
MSTDDWIRALQQADQSVENSDEEALKEVPDVWVRLAKGELSDEERAELESLRRSDPDAARSFEAFEPLSDAFREELAQRHVPKGRSSHSVSRQPASERPSWLERIRAGWLLPAAGLAAAAALWIVFAPGAASLQLPTYELERAGGDTWVRSDPAQPTGPWRASSGTRVELRMIPTTPVRAKLRPIALLERPGAGWVHWNPTPVLGQDGGVKVSAVVGSQLPARAGTYRIYLGVAAPDIDMDTLKKSLLAGRLTTEAWTIGVEELTVLGDR